MDSGPSIKRPKPGDNEEELFRMQEDFLKSKQEPSAKVINLRAQNQKLNEKLDTGQPENKPTKFRSKFAERRALAKAQLSTSQSDGPVLNPEVVQNLQEKSSKELIDNVQNIPIINSKIIMGNIVEKKPDSQAHQLLSEYFSEASKSTGFPQVFSVDSKNRSNNAGSLFYQSVATKNFIDSHLEKNSMDIDSSIKPSINSDQSLIVEGPLGSEIHRENLEKLNKMTSEEILKEKAHLESILSPDIIKFLKEKKKKTTTPLQKINNKVSVNESKTRTEELKSELQEDTTNINSKEENMELDDASTEPPTQVAEIVEQASEKGWVHMDEIEPAKLEWMKEIPASNHSDKVPEEPYNARFDFSGMLLPFKDDSLLNKGLHHHGEEPDRPGYSLQELLQLSRSAAQQQRCTALTTLANIMEQSRKGLYDQVLHPSPLAILNQRNIMLLLRFSLDDLSVAIVTATMQALRAFLYSEADEICLDRLHGWNLNGGTCVIPELPAPKTDVEDTATLKDHELAQLDCVAAAMRSDIVLRIRYILSEMRPPPAGVTFALEILIRLARHSRSTALNIATTPRLLEIIANNFIPISTQRLVDIELLSNAYGVPNVSAIRLCRILLEYAGRPVADRLNNLKIIHSLISYITTDTGEAGLRLSIEALRLWRFLLTHGLAVDSLSASSQMLASQLQLLLSNHDLGNTSELSCEYATALVHISMLETSLKPIISTLLMKWSTQLSNISSVTWSNTKLVAITLRVTEDISYFKTGWINNAKVFNNICSTSNLLSEYVTASERDSSSLPSFGVIAKDGQLQPAVSLNSCFLFLATAWSTFLKAKMFNELEIILNNTDIMKYLKKLVSNDWSLQNSWYTRSELSFIIEIVRSIAQFKVNDMITELIWKIGVKLIPVLSSDTSEIVKEILGIIFSNEKMILHTLSDHLNALKLNETQEMISHHLPDNIASIYEEYISSENSWNQQAMPKDWLYLPLVACYTQYKNKTNWNENDTIKVITSLSLEVTMPELFHDLSPSLRYSRLILVFLCDTVYLNKIVSILLTNVMSEVVSKYYKSFDFYTELPGLTSFTDLYTAMCECFCANSYGDDNFCMALLVPIAQKHSIHYRRMLWSEHAGALRYLKLPPEQLLIPLNEFLYPLEEDISLIESYITALVRKNIRKEWCPVLYIIAIHHSAMFLQGTSKLATRMRAGIASIKDANLAESLLNYVPS
ncbi:RNA polymerase II-associated protein 1 [Chelonus insularis]|uniref:RNA polymerase II-associated protein 1 n=1 Tax=Chelonus insularis TaxID=460826 RepID=UPI00158F279F|nr:RNA polymerase II-associated protein 1 [Chelonus insularis]XP_034935739.1 RNA polymerase II-associated protein 1 [Chelonus insularis]XP_034935740.1 RNA polymerase II-associated protein 1 [Chelonus insularis]